MQEYTLNVGDKLLIGGEVMLEILEKTYPKAIPAQIIRIGIQAPRNIKITSYGVKKRPEIPNNPDIVKT